MVWYVIHVLCAFSFRTKHYLQASLFSFVALRRDKQAEVRGFPYTLFSGGLPRLILCFCRLQELTTEHLVQQGAVFNQIFALKYESLLDYLSSVYNQFTYASDEDFTTRELVNENIEGTNASYLTTNDIYQPPVSNSLKWESEYYAIFKEYATSVVKAVYEENDENVKKDEVLQDYYNALSRLFHKMPSRYAEFKTVDGVTTFVADTINHLVIRHQLYGTTAVASVMDPRLGSTQTPRDGGPPAVDEWRSLGYVALATAYANFVHLMDDPDETTETSGLVNIFDDAVPVLGHQQKHILVRSMKTAWSTMQVKLKEKQTEWVNDLHLPDTDKAADPNNWHKDINYMYFRPTPKDCHTGPGY